MMKTVHISNVIFVRERGRSAGAFARCMAAVLPVLMLAATTGIRNSAAEDFLWSGAGDGTTWTQPANWDETVEDVSGEPEVTSVETITGGPTLRTARWVSGDAHDGNITVSGHFTIGPGGTVVMRRRYAPDDGSWGEGHTVTAGNMHIYAGGMLHADGHGFTHRQGPGKGGNYEDGASHGGSGGDKRYDGTVGGTYGSVTGPAALGSGGGNTGADGGGAIILDVSSGHLAVEGMISANGNPITSGGGGGSAGGSILINAHGLSGDGTIRARGGRHSWHNNGEGGGGRIAVILSESDHFGDVAFQAYGRHGSLAGAAGTVYLEHQDHVAGKGRLIVDNNGQSAAGYTELSESYDSVHEYADVTIAGSGNLAVRAGDALDFSVLSETTPLYGDGTGALTLAAGDNVTFPETFTLFTVVQLCIDFPLEITGNWTIPDGAVLSHNRNTNVTAFDSGLRRNRLELKINGDLTIEAGGQINTDLKGFGSLQGPGYSPGSRLGASHGGRGGGETVATYGSVTDPVLPGSGAVDGHSFDGPARGGGVVVIEAVSLTNNGVVSAGGGQDASGASGGSINIKAGTLTGNGTFQANGGNVGWNYAGGGGRIAFDISDDDSFSGIIRANGLGWGNRGYTGTILLSQQKRDHLVLGGGPENMQTLRLGTDDTMGPGGENNYTFGKITIKDGGTLEIDGNPFLNVRPGAAYGSAAVIHVANLTIESGGAVSANLLGSRLTPGFSGSGRDGGSYGGRGGDFNDTGSVENTYGPAVNPVALGSTGSADRNVRYGPGGGAVIIVASGTVFVDEGAVISSSGGRSPNQAGGGGSGGSVNITAHSIAGDGIIRANGSSTLDWTNGGYGGGGRIAVVLTGGTDFDNIKFEAYGRPEEDFRESAAGTVYREHAGQAQGGGELIIASPHAATGNVVTDIPSAHEPALYVDELKTATLIIKDEGVAGLTADVTVGDLIVQKDEP